MILHREKSVGGGRVGAGEACQVLVVVRADRVEQDHCPDGTGWGSFTAHRETLARSHAVHEFVYTDLQGGRENQLNTVHSPWPVEYRA